MKNRLTRKEAYRQISELPTTKAEAINTETNFYFTGKPCSQGHRSPRQVNDSQCLTCRELLYERRIQKPVYDIDKAKAAERKAKNKAKSLNRLPNDYNQKKCLEFYLYASNARKTTGKRHEVKHIKPLKCGGRHHHDNLTVITTEFYVKNHLINSHF